MVSALGSKPARSMRPPFRYGKTWFAGTGLENRCPWAKMHIELAGQQRFTKLPLDEGTPFFQISVAAGAVHSRPITTRVKEFNCFFGVNCDFLGIRNKRGQEFARILRSLDTWLEVRVGRNELQPVVGHVQPSETLQPY